MTHDMQTQIYRSTLLANGCKMKAKLKEILTLTYSIDGLGSEDRINLVQLERLLEEFSLSVDLMNKDNRELRRMICISHESQPYMDDGEAQGQTIDYMRDSVYDIKQKLLLRAMAKLREQENGSN